MHFPTAISLVVLGGLQTAQAAIGFGTMTSTTGSLNNLNGLSILIPYICIITYYCLVAWISGQDPCKESGGTFNFALVSKKSDNPCGRNFKLKNGFTYRLEGCGGNDFRVVNGDGSPNAKCNFKNNFRCSNGIYNVQQSWEC